MKCMKVLCLVSLAASRASSVVHAEGRERMGGNMSMGNGSMASHGSPQRTQTRNQYRFETCSQTRDGSLSEGSRHLEYREPKRMTGTPFSAQ